MEMSHARYRETLVSGKHTICPHFPWLHGELEEKKMSSIFVWLSSARSVRLHTTALSPRLSSHPSQTSYIYRTAPACCFSWLANNISRRCTSANNRLFVIAGSLGNPDRTCTVARTEARKLRISSTNRYTYGVSNPTASGEYT
jgi:hypothetical protein